MYEEAMCITYEIETIYMKTYVPLVDFRGQIVFNRIDSCRRLPPIAMLYPIHVGNPGGVA